MTLFIPSFFFLKINKEKNKNNFLQKYFHIPTLTIIYITLGKKLCYVA